MIFSVNEKSDLLVNSELYIRGGLGSSVETIADVLEAPVDEDTYMLGSAVNVDDVVTGSVDVKSKIVSYLEVDSPDSRVASETEIIFELIVVFGDV